MILRSIRSVLLSTLLAGTLLAIACSDKYQSLYDASPLPVIEYGHDTLTIRERDYENINQTNNGMLAIQTLNPNHLLNFQLNTPNDKIHIEYKGTRLQNLQPQTITCDSLQLYCNCDSPGIYSIQFLITNQLGKVSSKDLVVHCLPNKPAQPSFTITTKDSTTENWNYEFDAAASKDPDGIIMEYHFTINQVQYTTTTPVMNWTFHTHGPQTVSLYVIDDLQKRSDTLTQTFLIP